MAAPLGSETPETPAKATATTAERITCKNVHYRKVLHAKEVVKNKNRIPIVFGKMKVCTLVCQSLEDLDWC